MCVSSCKVCVFFILHPTLTPHKKYVVAPFSGFDMYLCPRDAFLGGKKAPAAATTGRKKFVFWVPPNFAPKFEPQTSVFTKKLQTTQTNPAKELKSQWSQVKFWGGEILNPKP